MGMFSKIKSSGLRVFSWAKTDPVEYAQDLVGWIIDDHVDDKHPDVRFGFVTNIRVIDGSIDIHGLWGASIEEVYKEIEAFSRESTFLYYGMYLGDKIFTLKKVEYVGEPDKVLRFNSKMHWDLFLAQYSSLKNKLQKQSWAIVRPLEAEAKGFIEALSRMLENLSPIGTFDYFSFADHIAFVHMLENAKYDELATEYRAVLAEVKDFLQKDLQAYNYMVFKVNMNNTITQLLLKLFKFREELGGPSATWHSRSLENLADTIRRVPQPQQGQAPPEPPELPPRPPRIGSSQKLSWAVVDREPQTLEELIGWLIYFDYTGPEPYGVVTAIREEDVFAVWGATEVDAIESYNRREHSLSLYVYKKETRFIGTYNHRDYEVMPIKKIFEHPPKLSWQIHPYTTPIPDQWDDSLLHKTYTHKKEGGIWRIQSVGGHIDWEEVYGYPPVIWLKTTKKGIHYLNRGVRDFDLGIHGVVPLAYPKEVTEEASWQYFKDNFEIVVTPKQSKLSWQIRSDKVSLQDFAKQVGPNQIWENVDGTYYLVIGDNPSINVIEPDAPDNEFPGFNMVIVSNSIWVNHPENVNDIDFERWPIPYILERLVQRARPASRGFSSNVSDGDCPLTLLRGNINRSSEKLSWKIQQEIEVIDVHDFMTRKSKAGQPVLCVSDLTTLPITIYNSRFSPQGYVGGSFKELKSFNNAAEAITFLKDYARDHNISILLQLRDREIIFPERKLSWQLQQEQYKLGDIVEVTKLIKDGAGDYLRKGDKGEVISIQPAKEDEHYNATRIEIRFELHRQHNIASTLETWYLFPDEIRLVGSNKLSWQKQPDVYNWKEFLDAIGPNQVWKTNVSFSDVPAHEYIYTKENVYLQPSKELVGSHVSVRNADWGNAEGNLITVDGINAYGYATVFKDDGPFVLISGIPKQAWKVTKPEYVTSTQALAKDGYYICVGTTPSNFILHKVQTFVDSGEIIGVTRYLETSVYEEADKKADEIALEQELPRIIFYYEEQEHGKETTLNRDREASLKLSWQKQLEYVGAFTAYENPGYYITLDPDGYGHFVVQKIQITPEAHALIVIANYGQSEDYHEASKLADKIALEQNIARVIYLYEKDYGTIIPKSSSLKFAEDKPSDAQIEAGNYKKKHIRKDGFDISIENEKGSTRSGTGKDGKKWSVKMKHDYGYIKGTEGKDGDHVDVILADDYKEGASVFIVNQTDDSGKFDEHKVCIGFIHKDDAEKAYLDNYEKGWDNYDDIIEMPMEQFKEWVRNKKYTKNMAKPLKLAWQKITEIYDWDAFLKAVGPNQVWEVLNPTVERSGPSPTNPHVYKYLHTSESTTVIASDDEYATLSFSVWNPIIGDTSLEYIIKEHENSESDSNYSANVAAEEGPYKLLSGIPKQAKLSWQVIEEKLEPGDYARTKVEFGETLYSYTLPKGTLVKVDNDLGDIMVQVTIVDSGKGWIMNRKNLTKVAPPEQNKLSWKQIPAILQPGDKAKVITELRSGTTVPFGSAKIIPAGTIVTVMSEEKYNNVITISIEGQERNWLVPRSKLEKVYDTSKLAWKVSRIYNYEDMSKVIGPNQVWKAHGSTSDFPAYRMKFLFTGPNSVVESADDSRMMVSNSAWSHYPDKVSQTNMYTPSGVWREEEPYELISGEPKQSKLAWQKVEEWVPVTSGNDVKVGDRVRIPEGTRPGGRSYSFMDTHFTDYTPEKYPNIGIEEGYTPFSSEGTATLPIGAQGTVTIVDGDMIIVSWDGFPKYTGTAGRGWLWSLHKITPLEILKTNTPQVLSWKQPDLLVHMKPGAVFRQALWGGGIHYWYIHEVKHIIKDYFKTSFPENTRDDFRDSDLQRISGIVTRSLDSLIERYKRGSFGGLGMFLSDNWLDGLTYLGQIDDVIAQQESKQTLSWNVPVMFEDFDYSKYYGKLFVPSEEARRKYELPLDEKEFKVTGKSGKSPNNEGMQVLDKVTISPLNKHNTWYWITLRDLFTLFEMKDNPSGDFTQSGSLKFSQERKPAIVKHPEYYNYTTREDHPWKMNLYEQALEGLNNPEQPLDVDYIEPDYITREDAALVHTPEYLDQVFAPPTGEQGGESNYRSRIAWEGGPWDQSAQNAVFRSAGGMMRANTEALNRGMSIQLYDAFHHAYPDRGEGFCVLNDVAIAAKKLSKEGKRVMIVDTDVHQGQGTANCTQDDPNIYTLSTHQHGIYPFPRSGWGEPEHSSQDIELDKLVNDKTYLKLLSAGLNKAVADFGVPDIVMYVAGTDLYKDDQLSQTNVTLKGIQTRDRMVYEFFGKLGVPIATSIPQGYARNPEDSKTMISNTIKEMSSAYKQYYSNPQKLSWQKRAPKTYFLHDDSEKVKHIGQEVISVEKQFNNQYQVNISVVSEGYDGPLTYFKVDLGNFNNYKEANDFANDYALTNNIARVIMSYELSEGLQTLTSKQSKTNSSGLKIISWRLPKYKFILGFNDLLDYWRDPNTTNPVVVSLITDSEAHRVEVGLWYPHMQAHMREISENKATQFYKTMMEMGLGNLREYTGDKAVKKFNVKDYGENTLREAFLYAQQLSRKYKDAAIYLATYSADAMVEAELAEKLKNL